MHILFHQRTINNSNHRRRKSFVKFVFEIGWTFAQRIQKTFGTAQFWYNWLYLIQSNCIEVMFERKCISLKRAQKIHSRLECVNIFPTSKKRTRTLVKVLTNSLPVKQMKDTVNVVGKRSSILMIKFLRYSLTLHVSWNYSSLRKKCQRKKFFEENKICLLSTYSIIKISREI